MLIESVEFYNDFHEVGLVIGNYIKKSITDKLTKKWGEAIVAFYTLKENSKKEYVLIGSGFIFKRGESFYVMTASHVILDPIQNKKEIFVVIGEQIYSLKTEVYYNTEQDYAYFELPKEAKDKEYIYFDSDRAKREQLNKTSSFVIIGYPSTKNTYHKDKNFKGLQMIGLTLHNFSFDTKSEDIYFSFDLKGNHIFEPSSKNKSLPKLNGMSGSIIAQIVINQHNGITLIPIGVFKEYRHQQQQKYLVGCTFKDFADEIITCIKNKTKSDLDKEKPSN